MRVGDGSGDLQEQFEPLSERRDALTAVVINALTFDVFEREIGLACGRCSRVEQTGNIRMIQPGEYLPFACDAFAQRLAMPVMTWEFDGHAPVKQAVVAFRLPYFGHSAFADASKEAPGSDRLARDARIGDTDICNQLQNSREPVGGSVASARQQSLELGLQHLIFGRQGRYPCRTFMKRQFKRLVKQPAQDWPVREHVIESLHSFQLTGQPAAAGLFASRDAPCAL